jgi:DNA polymerase-4
METRCVTLKVRYGDFKTNTFAKTLPEPACVDAEIIRTLHELVSKARERRARVRLIGVSLSSLTYNQHQMSLFERKGKERWERAMESVDQVRDRYGFEFLRFARSMSLGRKVRLATPALSR